MKIYLAHLASYNNGKIHGLWLTLTPDADSMSQDIHDWLQDAPIPGDEWAIHDSDGMRGVHASEYTIPELAQLAYLCSIYGEVALALTADHDDIDRTELMLREGYLGVYDNMVEWAEEYLSASGDLDRVPPHLLTYLSLENWARDAELSGDISTFEVNDEIHVFDGHV